MKSDEAIAFKNQLSDKLFAESKSHGREIHGIGVGKTADGEYCVRIYVSSFNVQRKTRKLLKEILMYGLPDDLPNDLRKKVRIPNGPLIEFVLAAPPVFASFNTLTGVQTAAVSGGKISRGCGSNKVVVTVEIPESFCKCGANGADGSSETTVPAVTRRGGVTVNNLVPPIVRAACGSASEFSSLPAGVSIWNSSAAKGTIGYFCENGTDDRYLLSCNHVLALNSNDTPPESLLLKRNGSGSNEVIIGTLKTWVPLVPTTDPTNPIPNEVDAAIGSISSAVQARITEAMPIVAINEDTDIGLRVKKHGLATCLTEGIVDDISCDILLVGTNDKLYKFVNQIRVVSTVASTSFAAPGDSGSLVFDEQNNAVGLLMAIGNPYDPMLTNLDAEANLRYALMNPIKTVLEKVLENLVPLGAEAVGTGAAGRLKLLGVPDRPA